MEKCIIVAVADNNAIGRKNRLLWHLPEDLRYFKRQTAGCPVIMGWMTYQSIGRPLPGRTNIVISIFPWPDAPAEVKVVGSLQEAYAAAAAALESADAADGRCFVIGGAYTYEEAMSDADTLFITHVHDCPADADVFFPEIDPAVWEKSAILGKVTDAGLGLDYEFVIYKRKNPEHFEENGENGR